MTSAGEIEGVIRFELDFRPGPAIPWDLLRDLNAWRTVLHRLGLTARDPLRYGGLAFGNVSLRSLDMPQTEGSGPLFLVSGSQTGGLPVLDARHYCWVTGYDHLRHRIAATGPIQPSSETMTHAAAYAAEPDLACVIHVHSPEIWLNAKALGLPVIGPEIGYGTAEMAAALSELVRQHKGKLIAMAGHRDGIVSYGRTVAEAGERLIAALVQALAKDSPCAALEPQRERDV
jgi:ribulose-5-phosphate 4-epimerase/fuculose-1-phosphate aldolase